MSSRSRARVAGFSTKLSTVLVSPDNLLSLISVPYLFSIPWSLVLWSLSFNDFGHFEEDAVGVRRLRHDGCSRQRRYRTILPERARIAGAPQIAHLGQGSNAGCVQLVEFRNVIEDGVQIANHAGHLVRSQFEVGQFRHPFDIFNRYLAHILLFCEIDPSEA